MNSFWSSRTPPSANVTVPNFGGPVSGSKSYFGTDLNGEGSTGTAPRGDILPFLGPGKFGRNVKSLEDMNRIIEQFNSAYAGKITPRGQVPVRWSALLHKISGRSVDQRISHPAQRF